MLKTFDYILILLLLIFAISFNFIFIRANKSKSSDIVAISLNGEIISTYPLKDNGKYDIDNNEQHNSFTIENGLVTMIEANCPDGYCLNSSPIYYNSQTIVCLPNRIVLEIKSSDMEKQSNVDSVVQ